MRKISLLSGTLLLLQILTAGCGTQQPSQAEEVNSTELALPTVAYNTLSAAEVKEGWVLLFDGKSLDAWRTFKKEDAEGWTVEDGAMHTPGGNGDLISREQFENFELVFSWKLAPKANSGVFFNVVEADSYTYTFETGPEYQLIDAAHSFYDGKLDVTQTTAANYGLNAPKKAPLNPAGEWNQGKIKVQNGQVTHWLNGEEVVAYTLWTSEWREQVNQTKFKDMPGYGMARKGYLALQDHGDEVWFRDVKVKPLN